MYNKEKQQEIIKKSHERSKSYGIDKERVIPEKVLRGRAVTDTLKNNEDLIRIAKPFIYILYETLKGSGFMLLLTDKEGCILSIIGDKEVLDEAMALDMVVGAYMNEDSMGTNAMGTAIKEDSPIQISAKEHFITAYHRWTCSAAPIHSIKGEIIGTFNLTGESHRVHPHTLGLAVAAVKYIENQIKMEYTQKRLKEAYNYMNTIMNSLDIGIVALDREGKIDSLNKDACTILGYKRQELLGSKAERFLPTWRDVIARLRVGVSILDEEATLRLKEGSKLYNITVHGIFLESREYIGSVILIKDMKRVISLVNKYSGMNARYTIEDFIGNSPEIMKLKSYIKRIADSPSTVLIQGESGTGKEILAQAIHNYSHRRSGGFVAINCGAISKSLIESELFGYEEGAFTGAKKGGMAGKFELANGGTLFLDEIGEMPLNKQVNLLRVLQEGMVTRVGGTRYIPVDARIIAATNKDLKEEVLRGNFREDLYYRLSVIPINIPPLRMRKEDIKLLVEHFLELKAGKLGIDVPVLSPEEYNELMNHPWKGNVRELENFIEKALNLDRNPELKLKVDDEERVNEAALTKEEYRVNEERITPLELMEKEHIIKALRVYEGNITKASKALGIGRNTLYNKIDKYNINLTAK